MNVIRIASGNENEAARLEKELTAFANEELVIVTPEGVSAQFDDYPVHNTFKAF